MKRKIINTCGAALLMYGMAATASETVTGVVLAVAMIVVGLMMLWGTYTAERLEKEHKETERRIKNLYKAS